MADSTQQTPASEHDGFIYGLESFVFDGKELGLISNDGLDWGGDERRRIKSGLHRNVRLL